jgi:hypothetical protein
MARDITEGRGDSTGNARAIAVDIGVVSSSAIWQNTDVSYDVALNGVPFIYAINDNRPYIRQTAPFKKEQFDSQQEPGEQSLTGWWIRSQSSFHKGTGIKFYDPTSGEIVLNRFADSKGVDVFTKGQVTLLNEVTPSHITTAPIDSNGRAFQQIRSIRWSDTDGVLLHDGYDVDKIDTAGTETHFIDYNTGADTKVFGICDDGTTAYWITNTSTKKTVYKKALTGNSATADTKMFDEIGTISNAVMEFVKERIVMCADNKVYEFTSSATALPTALYTHPTSSYIFTSITASGPAVYIAGYNGIQSSIFKFTLSTAGALPTLTSAVVAAEMPVGEIIHTIKYYGGYMAIGTSKGVRIADVSDTDGSIKYGPLVIETTQPVYGFACRDRFIWCATSVGGEPGITRIDLGAELENLRFAYANDLYYTGVTGHSTTGVAFLGNTDTIAFCTAAKTEVAVSNKALTSNVATLTTSTAHNLSVGDVVWVAGVDATFNGQYTVVSVPTSTTFTYAKTSGNVSSTAVSPTGTVAIAGYTYVEGANFISSGYITTGNIRYGTLEPKNFKRLVGRGNFDYGSMTLETVTAAGTEYEILAYSADVDPIEVTTSSPETAQEYLAYKFILTRDATDNTKGPIFKGYQAKATIATPRQRMMRFPVYCFDIETDRYNSMFGYEGRAFSKIQTLEDLEQNGDVITWQDLTTGETRQAVIEQITFTRMTPPDKRFDGFGGVLEITIRTV